MAWGTGRARRADAKLGHPGPINVARDFSAVVRGSGSAGRRYRLETVMPYLAALAISALTAAYATRAFVRTFLGPPKVTRVHQPGPAMAAPQWLLALLALRAGREVERDWLAGTLWPDSSQPQALQSLRMCLTDLRQALGSEASRLRSPEPRPNVSADRRLPT